MLATKQINRDKRCRFPWYIYVKSYEREGCTGCGMVHLWRVRSQSNLGSDQLLDTWLTWRLSVQSRVKELTSDTGYMKAGLNGFSICFNMRSTQLLNQMSGGGGCLNRSFNIVETKKKMLKACWKCVESNLNWFKLSFNIDSTFSLFLKMLSGVWTLRSSSICPTSVQFLLNECWVNVETV